jgi:hypothetical protein
MTDAYDLAANAPADYDAIKARRADGTLGAWYASLAPRERVGVAALLAERSGKDVSAATRLLDKLAAEAETARRAYRDALAAQGEDAARDAA